MINNWNMRYKIICSGCDHFWKNNDDGLNTGCCRAFPNGIPFSDHDNLPGYPDIADVGSHDKPIREVFFFGKKSTDDFQKNDFVYIPTKRKVDRHGKQIEIYQDSNPYADENGRYNGK